MVTVNSAKGPKLQQHDFAAQIGHAQRLIGIQPIQPRRKFGGIDFATIWLHIAFTPKFIMAQVRGTGQKLVAAISDRRPGPRTCAVSKAAPQVSPV
jgi:hypothetical protein